MARKRVAKPGVTTGRTPIRQNVGDPTGNVPELIDDVPQWVKNKKDYVVENFDKEEDDPETPYLDYSESKISDFTWHHHQDTGRMQLVDSTIHSKTGHTGGKSIWGGGR